MKVLLVYGTTEGQTEKVVKFMAQRMRQRGHQALPARAGGAQLLPEPREFDAVVIAASVRAGRYQPAVSHFVRQHLAAIGAKANAFVSVSLAAASHDADDTAGLKKCVAAFIRASGWTPQQIHHVAGAFRYTKYGFITRWLMRRIASRKGVSTDTSCDLELTDWDDVARFTDSFAARAAPQAA
jgi:menaquinone-dependent protoporphyrinogen oxidase